MIKDRPCVTFFIFFAQMASASAYSPSGMMVFKDGSTINCNSIIWGSVEVDGSDDYQFEYRGEYKGAPVTIDQKETRSMYIEDIGGVAPRLEIWSQKGGVVANITTKDGRSFVIKNTGIIQLYLTAEHTNSINCETEKSKFFLSQEAKGASGKVVEQITFGSDSGVKWNPSTEKTYPMSYTFDPHTGERLQIK